MGLGPARRAPRKATCMRASVSCSLNWSGFLLSLTAVPRMADESSDQNDDSESSIERKIVQLEGATFRDRHGSPITGLSATQTDEGRSIATTDAAVTYSTKWLPEEGEVSLAYVPLPKTFPSLIGQVAVYWGNFELKLNEILEALVAEGTPVKDLRWATRSFDQRKGLFRDRVTEHFSSHPNIVSHLLGIFDAASDLHWRRNIVIHGQFISTIAPYSSTISKVRAFGIHKGNPIEAEVTEDFLDWLWHQIAMLTANLTDCFETEGERQHPLSLQDRQTLRAFLDRNRPPRPNDAKP